jgi:hypothetical protein
VNRHARRRAAARAKAGRSTEAEASDAIAAMRTASPVVVAQAVPTAEAADGTWTKNPTDRQRAQKIVRRILDAGAAPDCPCGVSFVPGVIPGTVWFIAPKERTDLKILCGVFCPACSVRMEAEGPKMFQELAARLNHGDLQQLKPHEMHGDHPTPQ